MRRERAGGEKKEINCRECIVVCVLGEIKHSLSIGISFFSPGARIR